MSTELKIRPLKDLKMPEFSKLTACAMKTSDISTVAAEKRLLDHKSAIADIESRIASSSTEIDNLRTELNIKSKYLQIGECSREEIAEIESKISTLSDTVTSLQKERSDKAAATSILEIRVSAAHAKLYDTEIADIQRYYEEQYSMALGVAFTLRQQMELLATLSINDFTKMK